jgi:hypothetical protein
VQRGTTQVVVLIFNITQSSARVTTGATLILLDTQSQHVGFLTVRLREAVASTPPGGAPVEPAVSVNDEELAFNALHSSSEFVQLPTEPATQDLDDVESLGRVVHDINTVVETVPETSEVRWTMFSISQWHSHILFQLRPYANIAWKVMYLAHKAWTIIPVSSRTLMIFRITVGRSGT